MPDPTEHEQELIDLAGSYITRMRATSGLYAVNIQGLLALFHHAEQAERLQASPIPNGPKNLAKPLSEKTKNGVAQGVEKFGPGLSS